MSAKKNGNDAQTLTVKEIRELFKQEVSEELVKLLKLDRRQGVKELMQQYERRLNNKKKDYQRVMAMYQIEKEITIPVAGVDEAGRGPLAGPVVAAAVILDKGTYLPGLNDSKKISPGKRERLAAEIKAKAAAWAVSEVTPQEIDRINIHNASLLAMRDAVNKLGDRTVHVLVDGKYCIKDLFKDQTSIISGDALCASIAAASILAKVHRDQIMVELDDKYPGYGFRKNKGYPARKHLAALQEKGSCPEHRLSFAPVKEAIILKD